MPIPALWLSLALALLVIAGVYTAMPIPAVADISGPRMPGTGSDAPGPGSRAWSNPEYITVNDTNYASVEVPPGGIFGYYHTHYLQGTNFGFNIPSGSTINGIQATIGRMSSGGGSNTRDDVVSLIKGGAVAGNNKAVDVDWPNMVIQEASYGGAADLWGLTWTPADINASNFGLALAVYNASWLWNYTAYVDYIRISVTYTPANLVITTGSPLTSGIVGVAYSQTLAATGGTPAYTWAIASGTLPTGLALTPSTGAITGTPTAAGGPTSITFRVTDSASATTTKALSVTVSKGTPTITWANPADIAYGTALSGTQLNASASVPGAFIYTPASGTVLNAGSGRTLHVDFTPTDTANYNTTSRDAIIKVTPRVTTVTANARSKTYGAADPTLTYTYSPALVGSDSFSGSLSRAAGENAGSYAITQGSLALSSNYSISYVGNTLTINPKALAITANNRGKTHGDTVTFAGTEFKATGVVNSDAVASVTLTSAGADPSAPIGDYDIVPSAAVGSGLANYDIIYVNGTLTVSSLALTITANDLGKTYGDTMTFAGTEFTVIGLEAGDTVDSVTLTSAGADPSAPIGDYDIVPSAAMGTGLIKYTIIYVNGTLTVSPKALSITANNRGKTYGDNVTFAGTEFTTVGLANSDTVDNVTLTSSGAGAAAAAGSYSIVSGTAAGTGLANYSITYTNGTLTVARRALPITADDRSKTYGDTVTFAGTEFTVAGLVNSDNVDSVTLTSAGADTAGAPGTYQIAPSAVIGTGISNYNITYVSGSLTVNLKDLTITADSRSKAYGEGLTFAGTEFTAVGLVNSDTVDSITITSAGADASAAIGDYAIVLSGAAGTGLSNYNINYVNGTLAVRKGVVITANGLTKTYGDTMSFAGTEFTVTGLEGSDTVTSITLSSPGDGAAAAAGIWDIVPSAAVGTGLDNYDITYVNGSLTVSPRVLTITAADASKANGTTATLAGTEFTATGLINSDKVTRVTLTSAGADASAAGGTYPIVPSAAIGEGLTNYSISYVNGTLTVSKTAIVWSVTSSPTQSTEGDSVTLTATVKPSVVWSITPLTASQSSADKPLAYDIKLTPSGAIGTITFNYGGVTMIANVTYTRATGTVTFRDGGAVLGTATLVNGTATYTTSKLSDGSHYITASYDGDGNFDGSTTLAHIHTVTAGPGTNWWPIVGIIAAVLVVVGPFLLLPIVRRRRRRQQQAQA